MYKETAHEISVTVKYASRLKHIKLLASFKEMNLQNNSKNS